jgi:hypothetical protein
LLIDGVDEHPMKMNSIINGRNRSGKQQRVEKCAMLNPFAWKFGRKVFVGQAASPVRA